MLDENVSHLFALSKGVTQEMFVSCKDTSQVIELDEVATQLLVLSQDATLLAFEKNVNQLLVLSKDETQLFELDKIVTPLLVLSKDTTLLFVLA